VSVERWSWLINPAKTHAISPCYEESVVARFPPSLALDVGRIWVGDVRPPLRSRRAFREHGADDPLNVAKAHLIFSRPLAAKVSGERIVFAHAASMVEACRSG
jgi:hypothetical protein